jgi:hypothetical protein
MTDSSGRVDFEKLKKTIRMVLHDHKEAHQPLKARDIWVPLQKQANLREAYLRSELTDHLKTFARFIERASTHEPKTLLKEFDLDEQSAFTTLQRQIRAASGRKKQTEFKGAAERAFNLGSTAWAAKLLHKSDPTKFKVSDLIDGIRRDPEGALASAEQLVLFEFGERLLRSAVPGGTTEKKEIMSVLRDYRENCKEFATKNSKATAWDSEKLLRTVQEYFNQLTEK